MDEPASSLDADSEYEIFSDLGRITDGRTCIFISHRLSNTRDADRIIVLDSGRVAETGTHDELMAAGGRYSVMFTSVITSYSIHYTKLYDVEGKYANGRPYKKAGDITLLH